MLLGAGAVACLAVLLMARRPKERARPAPAAALSEPAADSAALDSVSDLAASTTLDPHTVASHEGPSEASSESLQRDTMADAGLTSAPLQVEEDSASREPPTVEAANISNDASAPTTTPTTSLHGTSPITEDAPEPGGLTSAEVFAKLNELALGSGAARPGTATGHGVTRAAIVQALQDAPTLQRFAPRRPNMLPQLLSAVNNDRVSVRELTSIIARDPALVGALLKIANSSYYRVTSQPVESLEKAVILLGTDGLRSVASIALMQPIFRVGGFDFPRFPEVSWEHTFRSATAAGHYNFFTPSSDPFAAELLALVLGLAGIVIFRIALDQYAKEPRLRPDAATIASLINDYAASVARRIGAGWELSDQTLAGLNGQTAAAAHLLKPLGRSVYLGRVVGALAVLRLHRAIEPDTARRSVPTGGIAAEQIDRMWERLTVSSAPR